VPTVINPDTISFPPFQPRLFDQRIAAYLRAPDREFAERRLRYEFQQLGDREASAHVLEQQIFGADLRLSTLYADQSAARTAVGRKPDPQTLQRIENEIAAMRDELLRLRARRSAISTGALERRYESSRKLILRAVSGGARLKFIAPATVPKGATIESVREKLAQLTADLRAVADAPYPAEFAKAKAGRLIDELARPLNVRPALEADGDIYLPLVHVSEHNQIPDAAGLLFWALGPKIKELAFAEIDACADAKNALTPEERVTRTAAIKKEILATERIEAAIEWEMMQEGNTPSLRPDASPAAILGVDAS
jgi:hypothetical protein